MGVQSGYVVACEFGDMHHLTTYPPEGAPEHL
jgi:hypothetical protein